MKIRRATLDDASTLVLIGADMHAESPRYSRLAYSATKVERVLQTMINSPDAIVLIAETGTIVNGVALAFIDAEWFSEERIAQELAVFVRPNRRGSIVAMQLIVGIDAWAKSMGVPYLQAGSTTGVNPERTAKLYEHLGFKSVAIGVEREYN